MDDKTAAVLRTLEEGVAKVSGTEEFKAFLRGAARFSKYSWSNQMLIQMQRPGAVEVAGFREWARRGRPVRKGEKGIAILAPSRWKRVETDAETGEEHERSGRYFRVVHVFDIAQTDGPPVVEIAPLLTGEDPEDLAALLAHVAAKDEHLTVQIRGEVESGDDVAGWYSPVQRIIEVKRASGAQMAKTFAHELAHHWHHTRHQGGEGGRALGETVAEAVAFVVCEHFGVDSSDRSFGYLAGWTGGDAKKIRALLGLVSGIAREMTLRAEAARSLRDEVVARYAEVA